MLNAFLCMKRYLMGYLSLHSITSDFVPVLQSRKAKSWNDVKQGCIMLISFSLSFTVQQWVWQANSYHIHQVPNFDAQICGIWRNTGPTLLRNIHSESQDVCVTKISCWYILTLKTLRFRDLLVNCSLIYVLLQSIWQRNLIEKKKKLEKSRKKFNFCQKVVWWSQKSNAFTTIIKIVQDLQLLTKVFWQMPKTVLKDL